MRSHPLLTVAVLLVPAFARADSLIVQGMAPQPVTINGYGDGKVRYTNSKSGIPAERDYARVQQLVVDAEPALSAAEAARVEKKTDVAVDSYVKAIRGTQTAWVKAYAARRIFDAAPDRFEPKLAAYLAVLQTGAFDTVDRRPALPEKGSRLLDLAAADVESALKSANLADTAKVALLDFLTEILQRRGDEAAATATVERMARASPAAANDPAVKARLVGQRVAQARTALDKKEYTRAIGLITDARPDITDPRQQADALYILAQARLAQADPADVPARQDAALAFLRVVVLGDTLPDRPNVLASLRAVADILEKTGDTAGAANVNRQIAREFPEAK